MANTLTNTLYTMLARKALDAFVTAITPIRAFANNFSSDVVERGDKVKVLFVDAASAALTFTDPGTFTVQDSTATGLDITINQRRYVSWHLTTEQLANNPQVTLDRFARQKGFALAKAVLQDIWSLATLANYGAPIFTGAASTFNNDDVADMEATLDTALWPMSERALILSPSYKAALVKDVALAGDLGVNENPLHRDSQIGRIHNFDLYKSALIPANGENLIGMAAHPDGLLCAMRILRPEENNVLDTFQVLEHEDTGIALGFREWFDPDTDRKIRVLECNYGRRVGNSSGLKRMTSA